MLGWADVDWLRAVAYLFAAAVCVVAAVLDVRDSPGYWRPFWPLTAALLGCMAVGRAGDVAEHLVDLLRDGARTEGWYEERRRWQAAVIAALAAAWLLAVVVACVRIPERRRRYLPVVLVVVTLCGFVAVRVVSLHQVDSLLHRRQVAGLRVGTAIEYVLVVLLAGAALAAPWRARRAYAAQSAAPISSASE